MSGRVDFFFRQRVTEAELDLTCELLEQAELELAADLRIYGIVTGAIHQVMSAHPARSPRTGAGSRPRAHVDVLPPKRDEDGARCARGSATEPR